jgi:hypothetical protein
LKTRRKLHLCATFTTLTLLQCAISCSREHKARLDSYRALATRGPNPSQRTSDLQNDESSTRPSIARLAAASLILVREDLLPCSSLPPRKLTTPTGEVYWLDGSWSTHARSFIVKGSAQSGLCRIELHPTGASNLPLGGRETFVRGEQIRFLLAGHDGEAVYPPSNRGFVKCLEKQNSFEVSYEGQVLGQSGVSYVMNESIHLELHPRVCLARVLDEAKKPTPEWVFILPTWDSLSPVASDREQESESSKR